MPAGHTTAADRLTRDRPVATVRAVPRRAARDEVHVEPKLQPPPSAAPSRPRRWRWDGAYVDLAVAGAISLAVGSTAFRGPATVDMVTFTNQTAYDIHLYVGPSDEDRWLAVGTVEHGTQRSFAHVSDQGETWRFRFRAQGQAGGELTVARAALAADDWTVALPPASAAHRRARDAGAQPGGHAMTEVTETQLPGVGVRHEFTTAAGERLAVLSHRTGRREIAVYDRADPDACSTVLHLNEDDTRTLADLLGGNPVSEAVSAVHQLEGVAIDWIRVPASSTQAGATIGDGRLRTRTGTSVVAVVRGDTTIPAPGPEVVLDAGDVVVAAGTPDGLRTLRELLSG